MPVMEPDLVEVVQIVGPGLEAFSAHAGIEFPPEVTAEVFLRELLDGAPGTPADRAFFARLVVSLMHPDLQQDQANLTEISELIRARLAARRAASG
jgi:hypothetical protein